MAVSGIGGFSAISPVSYDINKVADNSDISVSFGDMLKGALEKVNSLQADAENTAIDFASGKIDNIHQVTIAAEKADLALQFTMQVRTKILDAYNEIMRMQI